MVLPEESADFKAISKRVHMSERFIDAPKLDLPVPPEPPRGQRPGRAKPKADQPQAPREQHARAPRDQQPQASAPRPQDARPARGQEPRAPRCQDGRSPSPRGQQPQGARPEGQRAQQPHAWVSLGIKLRPGHNHSSDSLQHWISQRARVSPRHLRAVKLDGDHATFEVEAPMAERLMASLKGGK